MLPNYQARSIFVLKQTTSMYICIYVWMDGTYAQRRAQGTFFSKETRLFRLDSSLFCSETTALREIWAPNCGIIPAKLFFSSKSQKVTATGYYAIEKTFTRLYFKTLSFFGAAKNAACWLSSATGSHDG